MSDSAISAEQDLGAILREVILVQPEMILEDPVIMRALVDANEDGQSHKIVDLRGIALDRMEARFDRLEDTHRTVVAAAYENVAGMNQIHRAILSMLEPTEFEDFLHNLAGDVAATLRIDKLCLVLETVHTDEEQGVAPVSDVVIVKQRGFVADYISGGRGSSERVAVLRRVHEGEGTLYGNQAQDIRSEAALRLDFGAGRLPGMLVMGAADPMQFRPDHGTDLLCFFASVFERAMRRWLA